LPRDLSRWVRGTAAVKITLPRGIRRLDPMRETVLVVSHEASRTGAPILGYNLVCELRKRYNVIAVYLGPGPLVVATRAVGVVTIARAQNTRSITFGETLVREIVSLTRLKFAIVNSIESGCMLPALSRHRVPTITLAHEFASYTRPLGTFRDAALLSDKLVFSSPLTRDNAGSQLEDLEGWSFPVIPQGRCVVPQTEPSGVITRHPARTPIAEVLRPPRFPLETIVVVGAGTVQIRKGIDLFIECANGIRQRAPELNCRFVWIGNGYDPSRDTSYSAYLADQLRRVELGEHCIFVDAVPDLSPAFASADIFLLSSRLDPLPNVAIDAMTARVPVVCFDKCTGIADHLRNAMQGDQCVAQYLNTNDMVTKLIALAQSKALRQSVGMRLSNYAEATFNMERYVSQIEQLALDAAASRNHMTAKLSPVPQ